MKRMIKSLLCVVSLSLALLISSSAVEVEAIPNNTSRFLDIHEINYEASVGRWIEAEGTRNIDSKSEPVRYYVNETLREYNSTDLSEYSTEDLVVFLLNNHRAMVSMLYFSQTDDRYEEAKSYYHGLELLEKREDAHRVLREALSVLKSATPKNENEAAAFSMRIRFLEEVLKAKCYIDKQNCYSSNEMEQNVTREYDGALQIVYGFYYDYAGDTSTRCGYLVSLFSARTDHTIAQKASIRFDLALAYTNNVFMGPATSAYNGYSYAFYMQNVNNPYCIFDIMPYYSDAHFELSAHGNWDECDTGDIIIYMDDDGNPRHAGVIYNTSEDGVYVVSKWDDECLLRHNVLDVPQAFYADYEMGVIRAYAYTITPHNYVVISYNGTGHTFNCSVCNDTYVVAHTIVNGKCRFCGYVGSGSENPFG